MFIFKVSSPISGSKFSVCLLFADDHSRVKLRPIPGKDSKHSDYINANYVDVSCLHTHSAVFLDYQIEREKVG